MTFHCYVCGHIVVFSLFIHSSVDGNLGDSHILAFINNGTMNIYVQAHVWTYVHIILGINERVEFMDPVTTLLSILRNCCLPKSATSLRMLNNI